MYMLICQKVKSVFGFTGVAILATKKQPSAISISCSISISQAISVSAIKKLDSYNISRCMLHHPSSLCYAVRARAREAESHSDHI